jgi:hypothetical protein
MANIKNILKPKINHLKINFFGLAIKFFFVLGREINIFFICLSEDYKENIINFLNT